MMGKGNEKNENSDSEVKIIKVTKRKGKVNAEPPVKIIKTRSSNSRSVAGRSTDIQHERLIAIEPFLGENLCIDSKMKLEDQLDDADKGRWYERDAILARNLQEEFNSSYQPLSFAQSASQLQEIGITDPVLLEQLLGSGIYSSDNFIDDTLDTSYEALLALGERIGEAKPKGLPNHIIDRLSMKKFSYKCSTADDMQCVVCMTDYEEGEEISGLPCCHLYFDIF